MKTGLPSMPSANPASAKPRLEIGSIAISGVDVRVAGRLGAAIERAVAGAASSGALSPQGPKSLHLDLAHGADAREIAAAIIRALGRR